MPRYDAKRLEPKWQAYWEEHQTFATGPFDPAKEKMYVLDMFPYPSGAGLHVGHPEGYTATDIVCRYNRMKGKQVLHPMGWDAFGLPAEEYAIKTGTHPAVTTAKNIETFKRQLKSLGFSYDWNRELATTDPDYFRWTQWIFLTLFDTWYDASCEWTGPDGVQRIGRGRPISELPIPADITANGEAAVRRYQDSHRLAYQHEAPVNWCPALGTVLANEEVVDGKSERGSHPVERIPLRQWLLRITAYGDRLATELDNLNWPESIKLMQRNWIGRSEGAEVDFWIGDSFNRTPLARASSDPLGSTTDDSRACGVRLNDWLASRAQAGFPSEPGNDVLRIYTTRPDTLFGATYMVLAPEHPAVDRLTTPEQRAAVDEYRQQASFKSDLDRTELAKTKSGVFTGGYAINPVNGEKVPVWIADYVLISYGTGAIMAVPAHDERDWEFAKTFGLPITAVVQAPSDWIRSHSELDLKKSGADLRDALAFVQHLSSRLGMKLPQEITSAPDQVDRSLEKEYSKSPGSWVNTAYSEHGTAINSGKYDGLSTAEFKSKITADLAAKGLGRKAVNYRLRDWLFSRQRYWGEPFPLWHELDANGQPTGLLRVDAESALPITLPEMADFKPTGTPEPMLSKAPESWLFKTAPDGTKLKRETNTMPQWAGSCWYYLRFVDNKNPAAFIAPQLEKQWLPIDLYVGGAEHAVLHLLYSRFWHKVLFDRGHVHTAEPFQRLVNQGMILGEVEFTVYVRGEGAIDGSRTRESSDRSLTTSATEQPSTLIWVSAAEVTNDDDGNAILKATGEKLATVKLSPDAVKKSGDSFVLADRPDIRIESRAYKMSKSRGNVINPDSVVENYGADSLRLYEMFMGPLEAVKPWSMQGVEGVFRFLSRVWRTITDEKLDDVRLNPAVQDIAPTEPQLRLLHKTIKAVTYDIETLGCNTAISRLMEFMNEVTNWTIRPVSILKPFVLLLSPLAPHLAEELWQLLGGTTTLAYEPWPVFDPKLVEDAVIDVPVQINGKLRAKITVDAKADQATIEAAARREDSIVSQLEGKTVVKVVYVPGRMVNFVVK
ncbi:MAG: leucine--tRNA ligase [Planctomycetaceae bacterium]